MDQNARTSSDAADLATPFPFTTTAMHNAAENFTETPLSPDQAWRRIDRWSKERTEVGILFWSRTANLYTSAVIESAKDGRLRLRAGGILVSFQLQGAAFAYGPIQTWPRWPSPPVVPVIALQVTFENGDYLALAEGMTPPSFSSPLLPS